MDLPLYVKESLWLLLAMNVLYLGWIAMKRLRPKQTEVEDQALNPVIGPYEEPISKDESLPVSQDELEEDSWWDQKITTPVAGSKTVRRRSKREDHNQLELTDLDGKVF